MGNLTDIYTDDKMDVQPKPKPKAKFTEKPLCPRPVIKKIQHQAEVPKVACQYDLIADKGASVEHIQVRGDDDGDLTDICPRQKRVG